MRLVPAGNETSLPLMVSLGMRTAPLADERLELLAELLDVADVWADGAVVERTDRRARPAAGHVEDGVEVLLAALPLQDAVAHLVDPPGGPAARRALAAR